LTAAAEATPRTVSEILARRAHTGLPSTPLTAGLSFLAHAAFVAVLLVTGRPRRVPNAIPISLPVRVVSPAALGRPQAAPAPVPAPAAPVATPLPEPPKARPVIEKKNEKIEPSPKAMPAIKPSKAKPTPPPAAAPLVKGSGPAVDLPSAGSPAGNPGATGALSFGTDVAAFDADFPFSYYVQQLLALIGANWFRPDVPDGTVCTVNFRIQRSGQVADVNVESTSGVSYYDRAAVRAVFAANPLPPLPTDYRNDQLGVHLRFR
jgi:protein TonB